MIHFDQPFTYLNEQEKVYKLAKLHKYRSFPYEMIHNFTLPCLIRVPLRYTKAASPVTDLHRVHPGGSKPLPDSAHLHSGTDQTLQRQEDRGAATPHLRHRRQLLQ